MRLCNKLGIHTNITLLLDNFSTVTTAEQRLHIRLDPLDLIIHLFPVHARHDQIRDNQLNVVSVGPKRTHRILATQWNGIEENDKVLLAFYSITGSTQPF